MVFWLQAVHHVCSVKTRLYDMFINFIKIYSWSLHDRKEHHCHTTNNSQRTSSSQQDVPKDHGGFVGELDLEFVKKHQNIDDHSQQARDISQWTWLENLLNDLKHENASPTTSENLCLTGYLFAWICMNNSCLLISVGSSWEPLRMELSPTMGNDENGPNQIRSISLLSRTWHMDFPREMCYDLDRNSIDPHFKMGKSLDI